VAPNTHFNRGYEDEGLLNFKMPGEIGPVFIKYTEYLRKPSGVLDTETIFLKFQSNLEDKEKSDRQPLQIYRTS
jgi:hypothetical protein